MTLVKVDGIELEIGEDGFMFVETEQESYAFTTPAITPELRQGQIVLTRELSRLVSAFLEDNRPHITLIKSITNEFGEVIG